MNTRRCLKIAHRIDALLIIEIGVGIDPLRMVSDRLYMRDVLLVCDAHVGGELSQLAGWFRKCAAQPAQAPEPVLAAGATGPESAADTERFIESFFGGLRSATVPFQNAHALARMPGRGSPAPAPARAGASRAAAEELGIAA